MEARLPSRMRAGCSGLNGTFSIHLYHCRPCHGSSMNGVANWHHVHGLYGLFSFIALRQVTPHSSK